jgi:hypothetical protein
LPRAYRGNLAQLLRETDVEDSPPREPGWIVRDQIDYEAMTESNRRRNEFFNRDSINNDVDARLNEYIATLTDNDIHFYDKKSRIHGPAIQIIKKNILQKKI